jgi:hypothetical protein
MDQIPFKAKAVPIADADMPRPLSSEVSVGLDVGTVLTCFCQRRIIMTQPAMHRPRTYLDSANM